MYTLCDTLPDIGFSDSKKIMDEFCGVISNFTHTEATALYYATFNAQLRHNNPLVIECGNMVGGSAVIMAIGMRDALHLRNSDPKTWGTEGIDVSGNLLLIEYDDNYYEMTKQTFAKYNIVDHVSFIHASDIEYASQITTEAEVIHIDTTHLYDHTMAELVAFFPLLRSNGILLMHDYCFLERDVVRAVNDFTTPDKFICSHLVDRLWWGIKK